MLDEQGYLTLVDRKKDMIISGGFNVYSAEVEQALLALPEIALAAVIGVPHEKWGEEVKAVVVLREDCDLQESEILALTKERLGSVKAPKSVDFVTELPRTAALKIDKKALRAPYWQDRDRQV